MRRIGVVLVLVVLLIPSTAWAQIGGDEPDGRTPRQPRRPGEVSAPMPSAPLPVATAPPSVGEVGATPPAPVGLPRGTVRSHVDTQDREIALTLDDGYSADPRVLQLIESYGVHGTAFIVGEVADTNPWLINELARLGWLVCSHSYTHAQLTGLPSGAIRSEIERGIEAVERVVGYRCPYFRAPYGSVDSRVAAEARALGVQIIGWDASISDSAPKGTDPELQLSIAKEHIRPGSIVLGHFGATNSYVVLRELLAWLDAEDYRVGSVAELMAGTTRELTAPADGIEPTVADGPLSAAIAFPVDGTATRPRSLSVSEIAIDAFGVAFLLALARRRYVPRRRRASRVEVAG